MNTSDKFKRPFDTKFLLRLNNPDNIPNGIHPGIIILETERELAVIVDGDSMSPTLHHGDLVLIDKLAEYQNGNIVIAILKNETQTIKRYQKLTGDFIELYPENKSFQATIIKGSELRAIYKVVQFQRSLL